MLNIYYPLKYFAGPKNYGGPQNVQSFGVGVWRGFPIPQENLRILDENPVVREVFSAQ